MPISCRAKPVIPVLMAVTFSVTSLGSSYSAVNSTMQSAGALGYYGHTIKAPHSSVQNPASIVLASSGEAVTPETTAGVVGILGDAVRECRSAGAEYAASCTAKAFKRAASRAHNPDYYDARRELKNAARQLERLVSKNADRKAEKKKGKFGTYKAIKKEAVASVKQEALVIIRETETKLLRSSGDEIRKIHYKRIAQAVGSTKVIFRS